MNRGSWDRMTWTFVPAAVVVLSTGPGALAVRHDCAVRLAKQRVEAEATSTNRTDPIRDDQPQPTNDEPQSPSDWQTLPSKAPSIVRSAKIVDADGAAGLLGLLPQRRVTEDANLSHHCLELQTCEAVFSQHHVPYLPQPPPLI